MSTENSAKNKIDMLRGQYQAIMFVLDSVLQRLGQQPDQLLYSRPEFQEHLMSWQTEMMADVNKLRDMIRAEEEKEYKKGSTTDSD